MELATNISIEEFAHIYNDEIIKEGKLDNGETIRIIMRSYPHLLNRGPTISFIVSFFDEKGFGLESNRVPNLHAAIQVWNTTVKEQDDE